MRKEEENRVVRWAVVRGFHERTAAPSSEPRRQSRVQVVSLRGSFNVFIECGFRDTHNFTNFLHRMFFLVVQTDGDCAF